MVYIVIGGILFFALTSLRAIKVKSFNAHLLIDGIILGIMTGVLCFKNFRLLNVVCFLILLLWITVGTIFRKYYYRLILWFHNNILTFFHLSRCNSISELIEDSNGSEFSVELAYYALETAICGLIIYI